MTSRKALYAMYEHTHEWDEIAESIFARLKEPITKYADAERIVREIMPEESHQVRDNVAEFLWHLSLKRYFPTRGQEGVVWVSM